MHQLIVNVVGMPVEAVENFVAHVRDNVACLMTRNRNAVILEFTRYTSLVDITAAYAEYLEQEIEADDADADEVAEDVDIDVESDEDE